MHKVIFVPPMDFVESNKPIGVLSLATILKDSYDVKIVNYKEMIGKGIMNKELKDGKDLVNLAKYLCNLRPAIIGFSSTCTDIHFHIYIAKIIKNIDSSIKIVFGGLQATIVAEEALQEFTWIDAIGLGECESNIIDIINGLIVNDLNDVEGVAYRTSLNEVKKNSDYLLTENLDDMHFIDYNFLSEEDNEHIITIETGRGCPFKCSFCFSSTIHKHQYRKKSNKRLIEEIKRNIEKYNCKNFGLVHDLFTYNKKSVLEFCKMLKENSLNIKWKTSARIDTIDEELVVEMMNSGLESLFFGIESGSSKIQKDINKNLQIDRIFSTVEMLKRIGMKDPAFSFIYGFKTENEKDLEATLDIIAYVIKLGFNNFRLYQLKVFNGTKMYRDMFSNLNEQSLNTGFPFLIHNYYTDCTKEIYLNKKSMFPYTYNVDVEITRQFPYLDAFVNRIVTTLVKYLNKTSKELFSSGAKIIAVYKIYEDFLCKNNYNNMKLNTEIVFQFLNYVVERVQNKIVLPIYLYEKNIQLIKRGVTNEVSFTTNIDILPVIKGEEIDLDSMLLDKEVEVVIAKNNDKLQIYYKK